MVTVCPAVLVLLKSDGESDMRPPKASQCASLLRSARLLWGD
jgi:hypothetical protein